MTDSDWPVSVLALVGLLGAAVVIFLAVLVHALVSLTIIILEVGTYVTP